jgi:hypothetical protein
MIRRYAGDVRSPSLYMTRIVIHMLDVDWGRIGNERTLLIGLSLPTRWLRVGAGSLHSK